MTYNTPEGNTSFLSLLFSVSSSDATFNSVRSKGFVSYKLSSEEWLKLFANADR